MKGLGLFLAIRLICLELIPSVLVNKFVFSFYMYFKMTHFILFTFF